MASLLIVDDEPYAVEGLKASLDWSALGIEAVDTAFNVGQARARLEEGPVDVVICDLEMPDEGGLDLLAWIRDTHRPCEVIILTCHADLILAQKAMRLRTCDYLVKPAHPEELAQSVLRALGQGPAPVDRWETPNPVVPDSPPGLLDPSRWSLLIKGGGVERVRYEFRGFLASLPPRAREDSLLLRKVLLDFQQVLSLVLRSHNISAHTLLKDRESEALFGSAAESPGHLTRWVDYALDLVSSAFLDGEKAATPFGEACRFIGQRLTEDLYCEQIAAHVGLNPDYLSRLFKKETGLSVSAYLTKAKMTFAADLLRGSEMKVGDIASYLGYSNSTHFSQMFRKVFHQSPQEYRLGRGPASVSR